MIVLHRDMSHFRISDFGIRNYDFIILKYPEPTPPHSEEVTPQSKEETLLFTYQVDDSLLDPTFHHDFTNMQDDGTKLFRGGKHYYCPYG